MAEKRVGVSGLGGLRPGWEVSKPPGPGGSVPGCFQSATEPGHGLSVQQRTHMKQSAMGNCILIKSKSDSS